MVRYRLGQPQVDGGWERLTQTALTGVCRTVFPWTDGSEILNIAFGTHSALQVWQGGQLYDITPYGPPDRLGASPLATTNLSTTVVVTHTGHGYANGITVKVFGAVDTNGIAAANLNGSRVITTINANSYSFTAGAADAASSTGSGGGTDVVITPQIALAAGATDGTGSVGYGTGAFGAGPYGQTSATTVYYPRTWSFGAWGQRLLASPRGGGLYEWSNSTGTRAAAVDGAPTQISHMLVAPMDGGYQVFALGTEEEVSGAFNPMCIRHSSVRNNTQWSTSASGSTAREYILTGGGRIVAGRMVGNYMLVWTNDALFLGTFVGNLAQPWRFTRVAKGSGLIGPEAVIVVGQTAFWVSPDRQFYSYGIGGQPSVIPCPIRTDFATYLAASQADKIVAAATQEFSEIRFHYPDSRDGFENSRFVRLCIAGPDAGAWSTGELARTAYVDAGPTLYPIGVSYAGDVFYHERGKSADGAAFPWYIESADQNLDPDWRMMVKGVWPDFKDQVGGVTVTMTSRETPQGEETVTTSSAMAPGDAKADLMASGRFFKVKFSGNSSPTSCRIGNPIFEVERAGRY